MEDLTELAGGRPRCLVVSGHAAFPKDATAAAQYRTLAVSCLVEPRYGVVISAACTLVTENAQSFVRDLLVGASLSDDGAFLLREVAERYYGASKKALLASIANLLDNWERLASRPSHSMTESG